MREKKSSTISEDPELFKKKAAERAVEFLKSGMVVGLGTGSTTRFALEFIGQGIASGRLSNVVGIPSSIQTEKLAHKFAIPLTTLERHSEIDITIDGADEVDSQLNLIKGGGGALLREKVLAQASHRNVIIVDESKLSPQLGTRWALPIEVIPFAWKVEANYLKSLGAHVILRKKKNGDILTTDQDNVILDCDFGPMKNTDQLALQISQRAGILEHGLFLGLATDVVVAGKGGVRHLIK